MAWQDLTCLGKAGHGTAGQAWRGKSGQGVVRRGKAWQAGPGMARSG